jgi:hypothetical protein
MLIATSFAVVVLASSLAGAAAPAASSIPPVVVTVAVAADVPPTLVTRLLGEAAAVWRAGGVTLVWRRAIDAAARARSIDAAPCFDSSLRVVVGNERGRDGDAHSENKTVLGWIVFSDGETPDHEIYLSYDNAKSYMAGARGVVGSIDRMPTAEREMLLGRVMGRALAHEIGHYLLASKAHTPRGLMQATHTASDFFGFPLASFGIDATQREAVASRLRQDHMTARAESTR